MPKDPAAVKLGRKGEDHFSICWQCGEEVKRDADGDWIDRETHSFCEGVKGVKHNPVVIIKNPHAVALGRKGGLANKGIPKPKSAENGKLGGRPKKVTSKCPDRHRS